MRALRLLWLCIPILLVGCIPATRPTQNGTNAETPSKTMPGRFEPVDGRGPDLIAELRATPPKAPEFIDSESPAKDEQTMAAKGYVKVSDGYYAGIDAEANAWLRKQGS